jgi:hypothetical protein
MVSTMAAPKLIFGTSEEIKAFRRKHGMNPVGVLGAGRGHPVGWVPLRERAQHPATVRLLLHIAYAPADRADRLVDHLRKWKTEPKTSG